MNTATILIIIALWLAAGLITGYWMVRRGHDVIWLGIAAVLGPLFIPIALDLVKRRNRPEGPPQAVRPASSKTNGGVLVGLDGSAHSRRALDISVGLLSRPGRAFHLVEVCSADATADDSHSAIEAAESRLASTSSRLAGLGIEVAATEVLYGAPAEAIRTYAKEQNVDVIVVGRRGRGLSTLMLGSVSSDLVRHSNITVLVTEPERSENVSTS